MDRDQLMKKLDVARPGLSSRDFIPVLTHFCFYSGQYVLAYNDLIAIRVPCDAPIDGALKGSLLMSLLGSMDAKEIDVQQTDKNVTLQAGKSNVNLPYLPTDEYLFSFPNYQHFSPIPFDEQRKKQFERCLLTCGVDTSMAQYMGVTINVRDTLSLYSTNGRAVTAHRDDADASVDSDHPIYDYPLILPLEFCKVVCSLQDDFGNGNLWFNKDRTHVVAEFDGCEVFSKLSAVAPPNYEAVLSEHMDNMGEPLPIPKGFANAMYRASVITASEHSRAKLSIHDGVMDILAQSSYGKVDDSLDFPEHPDIEVQFDPTVLKGVLDGMEYMYVIDKAIWVTDKSVDHLAANYAD